MISQSRVTVLVKAYPQPSKTHSETVCCAGIDSQGAWRRLYPIRFRQLADNQVFSRWNIVEFQYSVPKIDTRKESCRVHEESIQVVAKVVAETERQSLVHSAVVESEKAAIKRGDSLALIRPRNPRLKWMRRGPNEIETAREAFEAQARQASMFDKKLDLLEPCPFLFKLSYEDNDGPHEKTCADWETSAAFFNLSKKYEENEVLEHLSSTYTQQYVKKGLILALGNMAKRPQTWQLLGIFPSSPSVQMSLEL